MRLWGRHESNVNGLYPRFLGIPFQRGVEPQDSQAACTVTLLPRFTMCIYENTRPKVEDSEPWLFRHANGGPEPPTFKRVLRLQYETTAGFA